MSREFDIIVYGASGYTGKLVSDVLYHKQNIKWAMAGRNLSKLKETLDEIQLTGSFHEIPLLLATPEDPRTLAELAARAKVMINCAGPFNQFGLPVVEACVESGCHYVDITGEPGFYLKTLTKLEKKAQEKGVCIVHGCGIDSIPWDLGVLTALQGTAQRFYPSVSTVTSVGLISITPTTGTLLSAIDAFSSGDLGLLKMTVESIIGGKERYEGKKTLLSKLFATIPRVLLLPHYNHDVKQWVVPVPGLMDSAVVRRTANLLHKADSSAPVNYQYAQYFAVGSFLNMAIILMGALVFFPILLVCSRIPAIRTRLTKFLRETLGDGPSVAQRKAASMKIVTVAKDAQGSEVGRSVLSCPSDPGYGSTAKWVVEAALCLVEEPQIEGGHFTTGSCKAMGFNLVRRLKKANLKFE